MSAIARQIQRSERPARARVSRLLRSRRYYVHHFWATTKPWLLQHTRCLEYFDFLNETTAAASTSVEVDGEGDSDASVCVPWLRKRRQRARSMAPLAHKECGGLRTCVFP